MPITGVAQGFSGCFLLFYLCIPFVNILVLHLKERQHIVILFVLWNYFMKELIKLIDNA